jgi:hypothetical protein
VNELSGTQKLFKMFVSEAIFVAMETESRSWVVKCAACSHERSIWEMGGVRYKAAGNPRVYRLCPNCNQRNWHSIYKK